MGIGFRDFLLNEDHAYLGQKVGDILTALHDLVENGSGMGTRQLMFHAESVVRQIRSILHSSWSKDEQKYLPVLQKVGVAIMKAMDGKNKEKQDLNAIIQGAADEIEKLTHAMGSPQNNLGSPAVAPEAEQEIQPSQDNKPANQEPSSPQPPAAGGPKPEDHGDSPTPPSNQSEPG